MRQGRNKGASPASRAERALKEFGRFLAERSLRLTAARAAIVEAALEREGHFPIEELVADLRSRGIRGSKATVYRTLPLLTGAGIVQHAVISGDNHSYETSFGREHHDHLLCRHCGKVVEFEFDAFEILQKEIAARHGFTLEGHLHQLVGLCRDCRAARSSRGGASGAGPAVKN